MNFLGTLTWASGLVDDFPVLGGFGEVSCLLAVEIRG